MTPLQRAISAALYDGIKQKADRLNFLDKMVLGNALANDTEFDSLPSAQQRLFLDVALRVIEAVRAVKAGG